MTDTTYTALKILGIGMIGIIIVMAIFYGAIVLIDRLFPIENEDAVSDD